MLGSEANEDYSIRRSLVKLIYKKVQQKELSTKELSLLKRWEKAWADYEDQPETLEALQGIFYLLSNPDIKNLLFEADPLIQNQSAINRLFADPISLRQAVKIVLDFVKLRFSEEPVLQSMTKGITLPSTEAATTFDVQLASQEIGKIGFKRKKITDFKHTSMSNLTPGPVAYWTSNHYLNATPNIYQTIKAAISSGSFSHKPFRINIQDSHFRYPIYQTKENFNIMLVLDISNSVKWIMNFIEKIIAMLTAQASASKDKMGLIVFQDDRAQILHYPTINVRHVIGTINTLAPKGKTPLADGIKLAMQTLEQSRFQVTGMSNAIVLLSDCFPEPITGEYEDLIDEPVCQALLHQSEKIASTNIKFLIINPSLSSIKDYEKHLGYRLGTLAAERAKGQFLNLKADVIRSNDPNRNEYVFSDQMLNKFMQEISELRIGDI